MRPLRVPPCHACGYHLKWRELSGALRCRSCTARLRSNHTRVSLWTAIFAPDAVRRGLRVRANLGARSHSVAFRLLGAWASLTVALLSATVDASAESICFGTVARGRLENGVALPSAGANYASYSTAAELVGRTYVHSKVRDVVLAAYKALEENAPDKVFVYGETGWKSGGRIRPHRTHQNGLSVDFMVPVLDTAGRSAPLPATPFNKYGYGIDFDAAGDYQELTIDFTAITEHLYQLDIAARRAGIGIALVIFDTPYLPRLFATARGQYLRANVRFMKGKPWVRHDEHYHVDFAVPCKPLPG